MFDKKGKSELEFENEVIEYLTRIGNVKQWIFQKDIQSTDALWDNFKQILERNNQARLDKSLSETEFNQVKKVISSLNTPYLAGQFLYGVNGVSQVQVVLDDGKMVFLDVFDQSQVGGGDTVYQVVNQIKRKPVIQGKTDRRFDITLLINGLPIIQIELKKALHSADESLNQMSQYIHEKQYSDIFSTVQILIAMTPHEIRYMANSKIEHFNKAFAFNWQFEKDAKPVRDWKTFCDQVLSIPMAHELSTNYMILDGTKNKQMLKVMRPYQVYATKRVIERIKKYDFKYEESKLGYIWHTTGSGKTITSFKTAWLASRLANVDKVIFLVDRIALTNQTVEAYKAYDPLASQAGSDGVVNDTANVSDLHSKLTKKTDKNIIVTSIQKMAKYVNRTSFKPIDERIIFIVDEAHRSTGNGTEDEGMLENIRKALPTAGWIGYTGTPNFNKGLTEQVFGEPLHCYTIREAISDRNVLGFKVEFKETIKAPENPSEADIDDNQRASVYDTSSRHVEEVVKDIIHNWNTRSETKRYNAMLTVHVGGNKASTPRVMEYFYEFQKQQAHLPKDERLKIAVSFSQDTSNGENQTITNESLHQAMKHYNEIFEGEEFDMKNIKGYTSNVASRLNKTIEDGNYLDLVIVIDQLLTGFDAPELNTLYIDRTLKNASLIQAYSRTNRIHNYDFKPYGNVVNYRWPKQNEQEMEKAFAIYSNRDSANVQEELIPPEDQTMGGVFAQPYNELINDVRILVSEISDLTDEFMVTPRSEREKEVLYQKLLEYNRETNKLSQYTDNEIQASGFDGNRESLLSDIGMTDDQAQRLATVITRELRTELAKIKEVDISQIDLKMSHVLDVLINYDYLNELIAKMANEVHKDEMDDAENTLKSIEEELSKLENDREYKHIADFVRKIFNKEYTFDSYPVKPNSEVLNNAMDNSRKQTNTRLINELLLEWGLVRQVPFMELEDLISLHRVGLKNMEKQDQLNNLINKGKDEYKTDASEHISKLSWIQYRTQLREAIYALADIIKGDE